MKQDKAQQKNALKTGLVALEYLDSSKGCLVRSLQDGTEQCAKMVPGPGGFAQGSFGDEGPICH